MLECQLEAETLRNRAREDSLAVTYVRAMGMFAPEPRETPAAPRMPLRRRAAQSPQTSESEWDRLTTEELLEWDIWREDAANANIPIAKAKQDFLDQLRFRKSQEM